MKKDIVTVRLHGHLGEKIGKEWKIAVKSIREAMHAINILTKGALFKYFFEKDKEGAKYKFLVNEVALKGPQLTLQNQQEAFNTELVMKYKNLQTLDVVPLIEGADKGLIGGLLVAVGVILVVLALVVPGAQLLALAGLTLIFGGISTLLSAQPKFQGLTASAGDSGRSYFFGGAVNITTEGGPVPLGYGELVVGSQVISAGYLVGVRTDSLLHSDQSTIQAGFYPL